MEDAEKEKIRAAFGYMGPRTQAGLTLEALAKGAGILLKTAQEETALLRAEVDAANARYDRAFEIAQRANKAMEKHQKHNGALEIAIQEAHRDTDAMKLQFEEARKIIAECAASPEFKKWVYLATGQEQDPCGIHAFTAKYTEKPNHERQLGYREIRCEGCRGLIALHMCPRPEGGSGGAVKLKSDHAVCCCRSGHSGCGPGSHEHRNCTEKRKCECGADLNTPGGHSCGYWNEQR